MILEQSLQPLARADRIAGQHDLAAVPLKSADMAGHRLVHIGVLGALRREVAGGIDTEVDRGGAVGLVKGRNEVERPVGDHPLPFLAAEIERLRLERAVAARFGRLGADAILVVVADRLEARFGSARIAGVADDHVVRRKMIEQALQPLLEQRQPMVEPGQASPFRHRLVERIAGRAGAEQLAIARAEALDRGLVEQRLGGGEEDEAFDRADCALGGGIEPAHRLDLVPEEVEPKRFGLAGREEIDQAAAHGIFAGIRDSVRALIAVRGQQGREPIAVDPLAGREPGNELADAEGRQRALGGGVDRS
jgi:hypothetical protein